MSLHREENVDNQQRLTSVLAALVALKRAYGVPVLVSTHPRTRKSLEKVADHLKDSLTFHPPFGFNDYIALQMSAKLVLSDSGTISEESSILGFLALTLRDTIERPEALDVGAIITAGVTEDSILDSVAMILSEDTVANPPTIPSGYDVLDTSRRTVNFIRSTAATHSSRSGVRK